MEHLLELIEPGKEFKVLYVEDDEDLRFEIKKIIERIFKRIDVACDGEEGLKVFETKEYDLIITDIEMSRSIREITKDIPIVVVSAYTNTEYFVKAISIGVDYYIVKPVKMPHLINTLYLAVRRIVDRQLADAYRQIEVNKKY